MSKQRLFVFVLFSASVLASSFSFGQEPAKATAFAKPDAAVNKNIEQQIIQLTEEFAAAEVRGDMVALENLLSDDFAHTHSTGRVATKAKDMEDIKSGRRRYESIKLEGVEVRVYGPTAVGLGRAYIKVINLGQRGDNYVQFLNVWVQQKGKWRMVAWQTTHVKGNS